MLIVIFLVAVVPLLAVGGVFAFMAKDQKRKGQSGTVRAGEITQGRASGLD
ncbi:hypothetical protein [Tunturiibacter gelidoferens]|uniref:Flagellar basal body-associated protein FliL n=3 Tax=Tunturiibacter TaxID=3154218 RepID=A0A7Y9NMB2_9BACT|nr:hypothetical protein [Edaphobacter lichenicola]MBB5338737.1 flagellar basal body-associated protein FliL [Edaphobacter lichenicola]NYF52014.1 flagellar basal body-associated protein FliL [Edaphobacter lichenicola]